MTVYQNKVYVGDIGTEIILDTFTDLSEATVVKIYVKKGDGSTAEWGASVVEGTKIKHVTVDGDISVSGVYKTQAYIEINTWSGLGATDMFTVFDKFA